MTHEERRQSAELYIVPNITIKEYDVNEMRALYPGWDGMSKQEKMEATRTSAPLATPVKTHNVTCVGLHEYIVDDLDSTMTADLDASHLAVGDDDSVTPSSNDTSLNNEVYREQVTDTANNGNTLATSTFLDSSEANGYDLSEVGLFTASSGGTLLNHSLFTPITKDNTKTITIDVDVTFQSA